MDFMSCKLELDSGPTDLICLRCRSPISAISSILSFIKVWIQRIRFVAKTCMVPYLPRCYNFLVSTIRRHGANAEG